MKRKIRIGLTAELLVLFLLSIIIATLGLTLIFNIFGITDENINKKIFPERYKDSAIITQYLNRRQEYIHDVIYKNMEELKIPHKMDMKLNKAIPYYFNGKTIIYIVNQNGEIINSNNYENLLLVKPTELKEKLVVKQIEDGSAQIEEIKKIDTNLYLVVINDIVIMGGIVVVYIGFITCIIIFVILCKGRLRYIKHIEKGISKLYSSDFHEKVPEKYNNELTTLALSINDMADKIKSNKENEKEFLMNISHDLKTPLTSILGFLNLIKLKKYDNEVELNRYIQASEEQSLYLKSLIDEFFEFSRLKWQSDKLELKKINLQELIRQVSEGFYPQLKEKEISIEMNFIESSIYCEVDVDKYMRVLENIFSNAARYSKYGTVFYINISDKDNEAMVEFWNTPQDSINEDELNLIFKRFYKKDASRNNKGAGLGLAIAMEIIKLHGFDMEANLYEDKLGIIIRHNKITTV